MNTKTIVMCVVALILGMLMFHMMKSVCGCKNVEGNPKDPKECIKNDDEDGGHCCWSGTIPSDQGKKCGGGHWYPGFPKTTDCCCDCPGKKMTISSSGVEDWVCGCD